MLNRFVKLFGGDPNKREIERHSQLVDQINALEEAYEQLGTEELRAKTDEFRRRLAQDETLDDILVEAFAIVREASKRTIGLRHYDVQLIGGITLHQGKIAEMRTGEGKTLVATLPLYLNALVLNPEWVRLAQRKWGANPEGWQFAPIEQVPVGRGTHLITVNDYLARRDARWMGPIYDLLGLSLGVLQMAARTENGKKAFIVDLQRESPHEDQHQLRMVPRREAYAADITYGTNSEFGFDYLRDNMAMRLEDRVQRGHHYAIIDEVDNVLIDEARTPLIISGPSHDDSEWYVRMAQVVRQLNAEDYEISERDRTVTLTEVGEAHVEELLGMALRDPDRPEDVTPEQARILGYLEQGLRAQHLFHRNKEYLVQAGKVIIIDEFTGRLMPGRRWSDGLHQAVEAKEGARVQPENITYATITIQNYFRMYEKLSGMTGTAVTEAEEFSKIYNLDVLAIPTNLEFQADHSGSPLVAIEDRDELGYKYTYYTRQEIPDKRPLFWKRKDYPDVVYRTLEAKLRAIMREILAFHTMGRPVLVGTTSVELSELISNRLRAEPLRRLASVLLLRDAWFNKHNMEEDGRQVDELVFMNEPIERLQIAEMRKLARQLEMSLNPEDENNLQSLGRIFALQPSDTGRLKAALQGGIPHEVLNARKHTEESQIIAGAGAFGAVTIATNMAGRGVDIKLGGELAEEVTASVNRILRRAGHDDPYDMSLQARRKSLLEMPSSEYGIYHSEIEYFLRYMDEMQRVKDLGGLHVVGSERHESRRIDNQLRGRSGRQGDPGSSRFYLSMEDELMRLFGGEQADSMLRRLKVDDSLPLEVGLVSRLVEQAQTRVEGANFDTRKHLLEYDDVLNSQRAKIYAQRDRIFIKDDLSEDVSEMLRTEVGRRVPESLEDPEGPWKLLSWMEQIQPTLVLGKQVFPSYTLKLLFDSLNDRNLKIDYIREKLIEIAEQSLLAEYRHLLRSIENLLSLSVERMESQRQERIEILDNYFDALEDSEDSATQRTRQMLDEVSELVHVPIKLSREQERELSRNPQALQDIVEQQVENSLVNATMKRIVGSVERRLNESLELSLDDLPSDDWDELTELILQAVEASFERTRQRLLGKNGGSSGLIVKDLDNQLSRLNGQASPAQVLVLLMQLPQGTLTTFDRKTHRRIQQRTTHLTYIYHAAHLLENRDSEHITAEVLEHLEQAQNAIQQAWGLTELSRLGNVRPLDLEEKTVNGLQLALGESAFEMIKDQILGSLEGEIRLGVILELGRQALTEIYRELLLRVISELWIEYLTQMEALRVSIGLEAYGQRDPLVQYKGRASTMFQELLDNIRLGVATRMFTFRPRDVSTTQSSVVSRTETPEPAAALPQQGETEKTKKSSRRRRRRR